MPKINSFRKLLVIGASLCLALLGVVYIGQLGILPMIFGAETASNLYPISHYIIQGIAYCAIVVIIGLGILAVYSYIRNRGKPDEPSPELSAIKDLESEIKGLRQEISDRDNENAKSRGEEQLR